MNFGASPSAPLSRPGRRQGVAGRHERGRGLASPAASGRWPTSRSTRLPASLGCLPVPIRGSDLVRMPVAVGSLPLGAGALVRYGRPDVRYRGCLVRYAVRYAGGLVRYRGWNVRYGWYEGIAALPIVDPGPIWRVGFRLCSRFQGFCRLGEPFGHPTIDQRVVGKTAAATGPHLSGCPLRSRVFGVP
jgi:hypothetical protein